MNPEGGISHPLASNTVRASCTHCPRTLSVRMYKWHVRWQKQQFNSPPGFSHLYCVLCSLTLVLPLDVRERQMLAAGFKLRPSHRKAHRSLLVSFPDVKCVFKHCIHDPPNTKWGFNYIWDDFFHWNTEEPMSSLKKNLYTKKMCLLKLPFCSEVLITCSWAHRNERLNISALNRNTWSRDLDLDHVQNVFRL